VSAEQAGRAARWHAADTLRQQQLALAQAWIDLWGAQQRLALQQEVLGLYRRTLDGARRRKKAGDVAAADVARIELDVQRAEAERVVGEGELARARNVIASLLAMEPSAPMLQAAEPWPAADVSGAARLAPGEAERPDLSFEQAIRFAADIIRIPSLPGEEGAVARRIVEEMRALGFDEARTDRAGNVVGRIIGTDGAPAILLSSHMDVVDVGDAIYGLYHNESHW
jgi:cobalt-zinc-cadmium efflux system outer membrane protein